MVPKKARALIYEMSIKIQRNIAPSSNIQTADLPNAGPNNSV